MIMKMSSFFVLISLFSGYALAKDRKDDWSRVQKIKQENLIQVRTMDGEKFEGFLGELLGDDVSVILDGDTVKRFHRKNIHEISIRKGPVYRSILIGAGAGFATGLLSGLVIESRYSGDDKGILTGFLAFAGTIVGGTGSALGSIDRWKTIYKSSRAIKNSSTEIHTDSVQGLILPSDRASCSSEQVRGL